MKKIVDLRCYVSLNGGEYQDTSFRKHLRYVDVVESKEEIISDWEGAFKAVAKDRIRNAEVGTNWLGRPRLVFYTPLQGERFYTTYTKKNFRHLKIKWVFKPDDRIYSIKELAELLPADQFCEWLKDQGISFNFDI